MKKLRKFEITLTHGDIYTVLADDFDTDDFGRVEFFGPYNFWNWANSIAYFTNVESVVERINI